jgi:hypothetical protein
LAIEDQAKPAADEAKIAIQSFRAERPHRWIDDYEPDVESSQPMCTPPTRPPTVTQLPNGMVMYASVIAVPIPCPHYPVR